MIDMPFSSLIQLNIIIYGLVRKCVRLSPLENIIYGLVRNCVKLSSFFKIIFILDLDLNYIDKL